MEQEYSLETIRYRLNKRYDSFFEEHSDSKIIIDANLAISKGYISTITQVLGGQIDIDFLLLIQKQHDYFESSLILMLHGQLDEALALLRMATELSRDLLVLSKKPELKELWKSRESEYFKYKKKFKFDQHYAANSFAQSIYKLTSKFGVHGHMTSFANSNPINEFQSSNGDFVEMGVTNKGIANCLTIWLMSLFAIYINIVDCLNILNIESPATNEFHAMLANLSEQNDGIIKHLKEQYDIKFA